MYKMFIMAQKSMLCFGVNNDAVCRRLSYGTIWLLCLINSTEKVFYQIIIANANGMHIHAV